MIHRNGSVALLVVRVVLLLLGFWSSGASAQAEGWQERSAWTVDENAFGYGLGESEGFDEFSGPLSDHGSTTARTRVEHLDVLEEHQDGESIVWSLRTFYDAVARPGGVGFQADALAKIALSSKSVEPVQFGAYGRISAATRSYRGLQIAYTGSGPAPRVVETSINLVFEGSLSHNYGLPPSEPFTEFEPLQFYDLQLSIVAMVGPSVDSEVYNEYGINITPPQRVSGQWAAVNRYPFRHEQATGALSGFPGMSQPGGFIVPISTSAGFLPVGADLDTAISISFHIVGVFAEDGDPARVLSLNAMNSLSFATEGPVFNLPEGFTVHAPDLGIIDNRYTVVPELRYADVMAIVCTCLALFRFSGNRRFGV